ncbi:MAG TPA: DUF6629 family protein [Acidimicrobiales bacterium]|nr:DUF6629 family protein [Acidimicrobiales bacterium]
MCFSAQADVAGGVFAGLVGIDALRHVRFQKERMLASLPLLFGIHQLIEAFVWWGLSDQVSWSVGGTAVWIYLAFAFVVVPVLVPLAVLTVEPNPSRRRFMVALTAVGVMVAIIYVVAMMREPVGARIDGNTVVYSIHLGENGIVNALYMVATCGLLLISSHRHVALFGTVNLAAVAVLLWLASDANTSLWCAWAAISSVAIAAHMRLAHRSRQTHSTGPTQLA